MCEQFGLRVDIVNSEMGCFAAYQGLTAFQILHGKALAVWAR